ncbi:MAG: SUMF1/EgtB/PvdO family nonheme iron enzyme [Candidatus Wallbacteria bacterium]|nr:SUMF1/EgtB/PvdO family nonheme iron enzyme [Candidatus Wallbacteria bacterium]
MSVPVCQVCSQEMGTDKRPVLACPACGTPHHEECWEYAGGCSTFACGERSSGPAAGGGVLVPGKRRPFGWEHAGLGLLIVLFTLGFMRSLGVGGRREPDRKPPSVRSSDVGVPPTPARPQVGVGPIDWRKPCLSSPPGPIDELNGEWSGSGLSILIRGYTGCFRDDAGNWGRVELRFSHDRKCQGTWVAAPGAGRGILPEGIVELEVRGDVLEGCWRSRGSATRDGGGALPGGSRPFTWRRHSGGGSRRMARSPELTGVGPKGFEEYRNPIDGARLVLIPGGEYVRSTEPARRIRLDPYLIGKTEVTVEQYAQFVGATGYRLPGEWSRQLRRPGRPVVDVDWTDAAAYCYWAGGRLPTEAEWEKAASGPTARSYPWGDSPPSSQLAVFREPHPRDGSHPDRGWFESLPEAGSCPAGASPYDVLDMAGGVWEWCSDFFNQSYYASGDAANPAGPACGGDGPGYQLGGGLLHGGSWSYHSGALRIRERTNFYRHHRGFDVGFRLARTHAVR